MRTPRSGYISAIAFVTISAMIASACGGDDDDSADVSAPTETTTSATTAPDVTETTPDSGTTAPTTESAAETTAPTESTEPPIDTCDPEFVSPPPEATTIGSEVTNGNSTFQEATTSLPLVCPKPFVADDGTMGDPLRCIYEAETINIITSSPLDEAILGELAAALPKAEGFLEQLESEPVEVSANGDNPYFLYRFAIGPDINPVEAAQAAQGVDGVLASPNFLVASTPGWILGPGSYAIPMSGPGDGAISPTNTDPTPPTIGIVDSGAIPVDLAVAGLDPALEPASVNLIGNGQDEGLDYTKNHGTQIVSQLSRLLPGVTIHMENAPFDVNSTVRSWELESGESTVVADDYSLAAALTTRFADDPVKVLNLSLGTYGCPADEGDEPEAPEEDFRTPQATRAALLWLRLHGHVEKVVAAAGNDFTQMWFYPAAFAVDPFFTGSFEKSVCTGDGPNSDWLISVGSTGSGNPVAERPDYLGTSAHVRVDDFSNYGCWVTAIADGSDIVSFDGDEWKSWSGTSFAAPCVAAYLAAGAPVPMKQPGQTDVATVDCGLGDGSPNF